MHTRNDIKITMITAEMVEYNVIIIGSLQKVHIFLIDNIGLGVIHEHT